MFVVCWCGGLRDWNPGSVSWEELSPLQTRDCRGDLLLAVLRYRPVHGHAGGLDPNVGTHLERMGGFFKWVGLKMV